MPLVVERPFPVSVRDNRETLQYGAGALMRKFGQRIPELRRLVAYDVMQGPEPKPTPVDPNAKPDSDDSKSKPGSHDSAWLDRAGQPRYGWCGFRTGSSDGTTENMTAAELAKRCGGPCPGSAESTAVKPTTPAQFLPLPNGCMKP